MADAAQDVPADAPTHERSLDYDAFVSYTHSDRSVVIGIQKGLHQIGRRLGQLRALRVFRDDTDLTASPDLWGRITDALDRSRFLIVTLSPQAAASQWVNKEVGYWLEHRGRDQLMLVVAGGQLRWDETTARFDPQASDAAPPVLTEPGALPAEPLFIDVSDDAPWDYRTAAFRDKITSLAAPIHGKPKDQLASDDLREQRRFRRLRAAAITGLAVLTVISVVAAVVAVAQRQEAIRRLHDAVVAKLNVEGTAMLAGTAPGGDPRALQELLAANAIEANGVPILNAQIARFTTEKVVDTSSAVHALAYSPDGRGIATAEADGTVRRWESATGKPVGSPIKADSGDVTGVAYSPDGRTIASASIDGTLRLWNADTGAPLIPNPAPVAALTTVAVSPDGRNILTGSIDGGIQRWDARSGQLRASVTAFPDRTMVNDVTFDRSGNLFAASGQDGSIVIYDIDTGKLHAPIVEGPNLLGGAPAQVYRIAFSPDGHTIAAVSDHLELFNVDTGTSIRAIQVGTTKTTLVAAVAFSPDGHRIATGRWDGAVQLWNADTGEQLGQTLTGHISEVVGVAFSPDGRQIATASQDRSLRLWNAIIGQSMRGPDPALVRVAFSPDGQRVAASGDTAIQQWDVSSGQPRPPLTVGGDGAKDFGFVGDNRVVAVAADGTVQVWDSGTEQAVSAPVHANLPGGLVHLAFSGDGRMLATGENQDGAIQLWDVATGRALGQPMTVSPSNTSLNGLVLSPDGHRIAAGYNDGLRLWNADTSQPEGTVMIAAHHTAIMSVAFSRDGTTVAAGHADGAVQLWDSTTRRQLPTSPLHGHTSLVWSLAFGVGHQLASGGFDDTLRLWDISTGKPTAAPLTTSDAITSVALSPDGRLAASASADGTVLLSPAVADPSQLCDKLMSNMSHKQWRDWVSPAIGYITVCPGLPVAPD
jgi:WD40 repeat protein